VALGVPISNLLFLGVVLVCPLMMMFMMRGMGAGTTTHGRDDNAPQEPNHNTRTGR
jgi:Protein of unknown function (DUF2933)